MPRINTQGVTDATREDEDVFLRQPREAEPEKPEAEKEEGEDVSPGNSSSASTDSRTSGTEKSGIHLPRRARSTERR